MLSVIVGVSFLLAGEVALRRRPGNRIGPLMLLAGATWLLASLAAFDAALPWTIGTAFATVGKAVLLHLVLAFPEGRLHSRLERWIVGALYLDVTLGSVALMAVTEDARNLLLVSADAQLAEAVHSAQRLVGLAVTATAIVVIARRWRRASAPLRRALAPVLAAGAGGIVLALLTIVASQVSDTAYDVLTVVQIAAFAMIPVAFVAGLLRSWLSRTGVAELIVDLQRRPAPEGLRDTLARTLGDPGLQVAYSVDGGHVDAAGRPIALPGTGVTPVSHGGEEVAVLIHDPALADDPELLRAVGAAAGLALHNERLQARLRARLEDLRTSRARIVLAGDTERRRLERNLHDGAQQRLVSLAMALGLAESVLLDDGDPREAGAMVGAAKQELAAAIAELRELAHGLHPAVLTERGLAPALEGLADRAPLPVALDLALPAGRTLPEPVAAALYYVTAEALTNAAKHAGANRMSVRVSLDAGVACVEVADDGRGGAAADAGSGLRGLVDRVEALDGRLELDSREGHGTIVRAEIPCGS